MVKPPEKFGSPGKKVRQAVLNHLLATDSHKKERGSAARSSVAESQSKLTPDAEPLNQRAPEGALIDSENTQQQPSLNASAKLGTAANGADADGDAHAGPGFNAVCRSASQMFGAKGEAVASRLLAALGNDVEAALDTLAVAADEADPMRYLKWEVERTHNQGKLR